TFPETRLEIKECRPSAPVSFTPAASRRALSCVGGPMARASWAITRGHHAAHLRPSARLCLSAQSALGASTAAHSPPPARSIAGDIRIRDDWVTEARLPASRRPRSPAVSPSALSAPVTATLAPLPPPATRIAGG